MASRTVTLTTCDLCGVVVDDGNSARQDGRPLDLRLVVDGVERVVDLCSSHDVELLTLLRWHAAGYSPADLPPALQPRRRRDRGRPRHDRATSSSTTA